ncbi:hypothetical protein BJ742DRAFT_871377, partial [Cladochytrium replicatum]
MVHIASLSEPSTSTDPRLLDGTPRTLYWTSLVVLAATALVLVAFITVSIQRYSRSGKRPVARWTRFQRLMVICLCIVVVVMLCSIWEMVMVWEFAQDHIANIAATQPGTWNEGWQKLVASLLEIAGQVIIQICLFIYFLVLIDRFTAFQPFMPGGRFRVLPKVLFIVGTISAALLAVDFVLVNSVRPITGEVLVVATVTQNMLLLCDIILECVCGIYLCKAAFRHNIGHTLNLSGNGGDHVSGLSSHSASSLSVQSGGSSQYSYPPSPHPSTFANPQDRDVWNNIDGVI